MAKESSFDIISSVDMQEVDNAFTQARKEIKQRYDLKDSGSDISLDKQAGLVTITAPTEFVCGQVMDVFTGKLAKRGVDLASIEWGDIEPASGATVKRSGHIKEGINKESASKISKDIRSQKFKAKVIIEGDKLRVSSAKKDTLQDVIAYVKSNDYGLPLQFVNYR